MKKTFLTALSAMFAAVVLNSCGGGSAESNAMLERVPVDADFVIVGNAAPVLESAGIKADEQGLHFPEYIINGFPDLRQKDVDELNKELTDRHIEISSVGLFGYFNNKGLDNPVILFKTTDASALVEYYRTSTDGDGYTVSENDGHTVIFTGANDEWYQSLECLVVDEPFVYYTSGSRYDEDYSTAKNTLESALLRCVGKAGEKSFASSPVADKVAKGNVGGAVINTSALVEVMRSDATLGQYADMADGFLVFQGDLTDSKAVAELSFYNRDGKIVDMNSQVEGLTLTEKVSEKALKYLAPNSLAAFAVNIHGMDWNALLDKMVEVRGISRREAAQFRNVIPYLEYMDGTVAVGAGFDGSLMDIVSLASNQRNLLNFLSLSTVVELKSGKAEEVLNMLNMMIGATGVPYSKTDNGISIVIPDDDIPGTVHIAAEKDMLIISTMPVNGAKSNTVTKETSLDDCYAGLAIVAPKNMTLLTDLGIDCGVKMQMLASTESKGVYEIELLGANDKFVTAILKNVINVMNKVNLLNGISGGSDSYGDYYDEYQPDYDEDVVVEEVVVDDYGY